MLGISEWHPPRCHNGIANVFDDRSAVIENASRTLGEIFYEQLGNLLWIIQLLRNGGETFAIGEQDAGIDHLAAGSKVEIQFRDLVGHLWGEIVSECLTECGATSGFLEILRSTRPRQRKRSLNYHRNE